MASEIQNWPGVDYKEVRAYVFNRQSFHGVSVMTDATLHRSVRNPEGVLLSENQVERLIQAITTKEGEVHHWMCLPVFRHGFVFYNADGQPVVVVDVCLHCEDVHTHPAVSEKPFDFQELFYLLRELGLRKRRR